MSVRIRRGGVLPLSFNNCASSKWMWKGCSQPPEELVSVQISAVLRFTRLRGLARDCGVWSMSGSQNSPLMVHDPFERPSAKVRRCTTSAVLTAGKGRNLVGALLGAATTPLEALDLGVWQRAAVG